MGVVRVTDVDGDAGFANGEDRLVMQDGGAHISEFSQLSVGELSDRAWPVYDSWVGHQETRDIRPVFIHRSVYAARNDRAGDITTATRERFNSAIGQRAVEAGHDSRLLSAESFRDGGLGFIGKEAS